MGNSLSGTTQEFQNGTVGLPTPSAAHAWLIIIVALGILWLLGGVVFRRVRI
jgi:hypothetical protein